MFKKIFKNKNGFTIVELSIVIVVIGVLASITIVGTDSYLNRAAESNIKNSLISAHAEMKKAFNRDGKYPLLIPRGSSLNGVMLTLSDYSVNPNTFCITGTSRDFLFRINQDDTKPHSGSCPGYVAPEDPDPDPDPGGELALNIDEDVIVNPANAEDIVGLSGVGVPVSVSGGESPYTYELSGNSGSTSIADSDPNRLYLVDNDAATSGNSFLIIMPNVIYDLVPGASQDLADKLLIIDASGGDLMALCNDWVGHNIVAHLKLAVTDNSNNNAHADFTLRCEYN